MIKDLIDGAVGSTAMKTSVRCATTANITLSGFQTIDGIVLAVDDENLRVLVKDQTDTTENGLYDAKSGDWTRCQDFDGSRDVVKGTLIPVNGGTTYTGAVFKVTTNDPIVIGTSELTFTDYSSLSATAAQQAQAAAEAAQAAAETAETNAETAQSAAEAAETNAETAQGLAEAAQTAAETAEANAEAAQALAEAAADSAALVGFGNFNFGVYANTTPDMYMNIGAGSICLNGTITNYAAQLNLAELTAPVSNPRIDRVVVDLYTGVGSIVAGSEAASPVAPDVPLGKVSAAQITLQTSTTAITDAMIENEFPAIVGDPKNPRFLTMPDGFDWPGLGIASTTVGNQFLQRSFVIRKGLRGDYILDFSVWRPPELVGTSAGFSTYYVAPSGNDTNDGLAKETPFLSIDKALSISGAREIVLAPGHYNISSAWTASPTTANFTMRVDQGGKAVLYQGERLGSWVDEGSGVYSNTVTGTVCNVVETRFYDEYGNNLALQEYVDEAALASVTTGGWAIDGTTIYVKVPAVGGLYAAPTSVHTFILHNDEQPILAPASSSRVYIKGVEFWGGTHAMNTNGANGLTAYFEDCDFAYSDGNGLDADNHDAGLFLKNCRAFCNKNDGFNYHNTSTNWCYVIEYNCSSYNNGLYNDDGISNGSTMHNEGRIIRINGIYGGNNGPNIADIDDSHSWNIGVSSFSAKSTTGIQASFESWGGSGAGDARMWLDDCYSYDSPYDLYAHNGGKIYIRNIISQGSYYEETAGDIDTY